MLHLIRHELKSLSIGYFNPIFSISLISAFIAIPFHYGNYKQIITEIIPIVWGMVAFVYLVIHVFSSIFFRNSFYKSTTCLALSFLLIGGAFKIMHWPGGLLSLVTGIGLAVIGLAIKIMEKHSSVLMF